MRSLERVRLLPGRLCTGFLNKRRQGEQEEEQQGQRQEPPDSVAQVPESPPVQLHAGVSGPAGNFCISWSFDVDSREFSPWDLLARECHHLSYRETPW